MPQARQATLATQARRTQDADKLKRAALDKRRRQEAKRRQAASERRQQEDDHRKREEEQRRLATLKERKRAADVDAGFLTCDDCKKGNISENKGGFDRHLVHCAAYQKRVQRGRMVQEVSPTPTRAFVDRVDDGNIYLY